MEARRLPIRALSLAAILACGAPALAHTDVTPAAALAMVSADPGLPVYDVREPSEYCGGHIPGSLNLPWNSGAFKAGYGEIPADAPVLIVCGSGTRSNMAAAFLDGKGYLQVHDMTGGMSVWTGDRESCTLPPADLACAGGPLRVDLSWDEPEAYAAVRIVRDGAQVARIPGGRG